LAVRCDHPVNDNEWHILTIKRRAKELEARIDDCQPATSPYHSASHRPTAVSQTHFTVDSHGSTRKSWQRINVHARCPQLTVSKQRGRCSAPVVLSAFFWIVAAYRHDSRPKSAGLGSAAAECRLHSISKPGDL